MAKHYRVMAKRSNGRFAPVSSFNGRKPILAVNAIHGIVLWDMTEQAKTETLEYLKANKDGEYKLVVTE